MTRASPKRHQDRERVQRARLDQIPAGLWKRIRLKFPREVREFVDQLAAGGVKLLDILHLEAAAGRGVQALIDEAKAERAQASAARKAHDKLAAKVARMRREKQKVDAKTEEKLEELSAALNYEAPGLRSIGALESTALQSRKHMRVIAEAIGPGLGPTDQPAPLPAGYTRETMQERASKRPPDEIMN